jgi:glucosamine 6-phosphate synthetase-like amidotransferase/phosphosugar isomerase protein
MCGIVGAIGKGNVVPVLVDGLKRLEYRGYDSSGIAVLDGGTIHRVRRVGACDGDGASRTSRENQWFVWALVIRAGQRTAA